MDIQTSPSSPLQPLQLRDNLFADSLQSNEHFQIVAIPITPSKGDFKSPIMYGTSNEKQFLRSGKTVTQSGRKAPNHHIPFDENLNTDCAIRFSATDKKSSTVLTSKNGAGGSQ